MKLTLFPLFKLFLYTIGYFCSVHKIAIAQITSDDTTGTTVNADGDSFTIQDGSRRGNNLFHSFQDFSVPIGVEAFFVLLLIDLLLLTMKATLIVEFRSTSYIHILV